VHPLNAFVPILVTLGALILVNEEHDRNTSAPILVKLVDNVHDVKLEQFWNAAAANVVALDMLIEVNLEQLINALALTVVMLLVLTYVIEVKFEHPANALTPIIVTLELMVTDANKVALAAPYDDADNVVLVEVSVFPLVKRKVVVIYKLNKNKNKNKNILNYHIEMHKNDIDESVMIDVSIDNYDVNVEKDIVIDDLETIRFESVPEKRQTNNSLPVTECSIFDWIFSCFT
jgi:hypothetical protein